LKCPNNLKSWISKIILLEVETGILQFKANQNKVSLRPCLKTQTEKPKDCECGSSGRGLA
jgi:hypothetical protein